MPERPDQGERAGAGDGLLQIHLSVHDLTPANLPAVREVLAFLRQRGIGRTTLLVVPGLDWSPAGIDALRGFQEEGHILAGHGWTHHVERWGSPLHFLHGLILSRRVAEHLGLDARGIAELLCRNHAWFAAHGLAAPTHYVPPAWAMGRIGRHILRTLPFGTYEYLGGFYRAGDDRFVPSALVGYEADTSLRAGFLRAFNAWNLRRARRLEVLRIALHPHDLRLRLCRDLERLLASPLVAPARSQPLPPVLRADRPA